MSYTKQTWNTGDTITAEKLNHMEDGIGSGGTAYDLVINTAGNVPFADGLSFAELLNNGGYAKALLQDSGTDYVESIAFVSSPAMFGNTAKVRFKFINYSNPTDIYCTSILLQEDGNYSLGDESGTYTYANGHYTFTAAGENL